jgi:hypothetical protein
MYNIYNSEKTNYYFAYTKLKMCTEEDFRGKWFSSKVSPFSAQLIPPKNTNTKESKTHYLKNKTKLFRSLSHSNRKIYDIIFNCVIAKLLIYGLIRS